MSTETYDEYGVNTKNSFNTPPPPPNMEKSKPTTDGSIAPPWKLSFGKIVDSEGRKVCNLIRQPDIKRATAIADLIVLAPSLLPLLYTALDALVEHGDESTEPWIREQLEKLTGQ